jgi:DNA gyrase inhibitor GyrI
MSGFDMNEFIAQTPEQVFDFITNPNNAPKIMASVKNTVKLTEGPAGVGTRYQETRIMQGKEQHSELEIVAFEPPNNYSMMNVTEGITTTYHYHLQPEYMVLKDLENNTGLLPNRATATNVRLEQVRPIIVAFVRHVGPYDEILEKSSPLSKLWDALFHWGNANVLINADSLLIGIPQDDPSITAPEKQRFDVCVQINEFRNPSGQIGCQTISAGTFGVGRHYGSFDNLSETYTHIYDTLVSTSKYQMREQVPFEVYSYSRVKEDIRIHFTDVYLPVGPIDQN